MAISGTNWDNCVVKRGNCRVCGTEFQEQQTYYATLIDESSRIDRYDYCENCWDDQRGQQSFSFWRAKVPARQEQRQLFVSNDVLLDVFRRLVTNDGKGKEAFTFVLALVLMRKRLVRQIATDNDHDGEWWTVKLTGSDDQHRIHNPNLTEDQFSQIREQLNEVLAGS